MAIYTTPNGARVDSVTGKLATGPNDFLDYTFDRVGAPKSTLQTLPDNGSYSGGLQKLNTVNSQALSSPSAPINLPNFPQTNPQELQNEIRSLPAILDGSNQPLPEETTQNALRSELMRSLDVLGGRGAATIEAENAAGIPEQTKRLQELSARGQALEAESLAIPLQIQEEFTGRGATAGGVEPIQTSRLRQNAIQSLSVRAQASALQGNIALAQQQVDRAIQLKYEPEERRLAFLKQAYEFNREDLERASKSRADRMRIEIEERERVLNERKDNKNTGLAMAMAAVNNFPNDPQAQSAAQKAITLDESSNTYLQDVLKLLGPYQKDPIALAQAVADLDYRRALSSKAYADARPQTTGGEQLYSGLSGATATAVRSKVSKFSSEPVVQNFATIQEGYNFASAIPDNTQNPADDQALIYSLAKALDPGSVVREGEYATAQKYAQSWVAAYGKGVTQAISGTGFLSEQARRNIKQVIKQKYEASKNSYDGLYKNYSTGINALTGRSDGTVFLQDYYIQPTDVARNIDKYSSFRSQLSPGEILVLRNGQPYAIAIDELDLETDVLPPDPSLMSLR